MSDKKHAKHHKKHKHSKGKCIHKDGTSHKIHRR